MKTQNVKIKDLLEGSDAMMRIAKEEKSGDHKMAYRFGSMQRKVSGHISESSSYDFARRSLLRQSTTLTKATNPDGTPGEERRTFSSESDREAFQDEIEKLLNKSVSIPVGFLNPAEFDLLKLDKPITGPEMAAAWWLFDAAALDALEAELDAGGLGEQLEQEETNNGIQRDTRYA